MEQNGNQTQTQNDVHNSLQLQKAAEHQNVVTKIYLNDGSCNSFLHVQKSGIGIYLKQNWKLEILWL